MSDYVGWRDVDKNYITIGILSHFITPCQLLTVKECLKTFYPDEEFTIENVKYIIQCAIWYGKRDYLLRPHTDEQDSKMSDFIAFDDEIKYNRLLNRNPKYYKLHKYIKDDVYNYL